MMRVGARAATAAVAVCSSMVACGQRTSPPAPPVDAELSHYVLDDVPTDIPHKSFFDFEGKVHLLGYAISPEGEDKPGSNVKITLYWESVAPLRGGWQLFTHLLDATSRRLVMNLDNEGPLRKRTLINDRPTQALAPAFWQPGHVYVDEQSFQIPRDTRAPSLAFTVGIWLDGSWLVPAKPASSAEPRPAPSAAASADLATPPAPDSRLAIISGTHDSENRAIVVNIPTGVVVPSNAAQPSQKPVQK